MLHKKRNIYLLLFSGCLAGYIWLYAGLSCSTSLNNTGSGLCILKHVTGIPCPSCGSTRSVISILHGDYVQALQWNPLGFLLITLLIVLPAWIFYDFIAKKDSLIQFYISSENRFKQKKIAIPSFILLGLNWYWNIHKGL
jgi:hypothetical protein